MLSNSLHACFGLAAVLPQRTSAADGAVAAASSHALSRAVSSCCAVAARVSSTPSRVSLSVAQSSTHAVHVSTAVSSCRLRSPRSSSSCETNAERPTLSSRLLPTRSVHTCDASTSQRPHCGHSGHITRHPGGGPGSAAALAALAAWRPAGAPWIASPARSRSLRPVSRTPAQPAAPVQGLVREASARKGRPCEVARLQRLREVVGAHLA